MSLGRPCGIADHDCDIELPLDVDCIATAFDLPDPMPGPTSMTSSILFTKLCVASSSPYRNRSTGC